MYAFKTISYLKLKSFISCRLFLLFINKTFNLV